GEGTYLFPLLEFANRVVDRLGPGLMVLVGQIDFARRQGHLHELVRRLITRQIDDHHAGHLAGNLDVADDHFRLGNLAGLRVALRFERQWQFELTQGPNVFDLRNRAIHPHVVRGAPEFAILFPRPEEDQEGEPRPAVDLLGQPEADSGLAALYR